MFEFRVLIRARVAASTDEVADIVSEALEGIGASGLQVIEVAEVD
jgi:hypothetical protein